MHTTDTIIAGIDLSAGSVAALTQAVHIAIAEGAPLELFHTVPRLVIIDLADALGRDASQLEAEVVTDARQQLQELLPHDIDPARVVIKVVVGQPLDEMLKEVSQERPQLLVLGVTGASGSSQGAGTFATKCIRKAQSDVLLVHEHHSGPFQTIVVCTDFSETSTHALAAAVRLARRDKSALHVLHIYYGPWHKLHYRAPTPEASPAFQRQYLNRLQRLLDAFVNPFSSELNGLVCESHLHEHQSYGRGIVEYSEAHDADLIILGTLGTSNLRYMLLGSTAERVLRETPCSVLTVRAAREA